MKQKFTCKKSGLGLDTASLRSERLRRCIAGGLNWVIVVIAFCWLTTGCQTHDPDKRIFEIYDSVGKTGFKADSEASTRLTLREGDVVKLTFPSAPTLNTSQVIRRDGKMSLQMIGEVNAAGRTPKELETEILNLYAPQLLTKEVSLTVESSTFPVFVTGAVLRPGKIVVDRPLTALEAVMEAGGFDHTKANIKAVNVIRQENGQFKNYKVNLKLPLTGKASDPFNLKPSDIVFVPERFSWF
ncbi:MAG: polysaccharide biosynthesis/export family protein [Verrucomicrobiota bacterium]